MTEAGALLALLFVGLSVWFWRWALDGKTLAQDMVRHLLKKRGVQLLDQTVALKGVRPSLEPLAVLRRYGFDYSPDGLTRLRGSLYLAGSKPYLLELQPADGSGKGPELTTFGGTR